MKFVTLLSIGALISSKLPPASASTSCRALPGDLAWPSLLEWQTLNATVNGRLVATVPLGSPCHDPNYNETECAYLQSQWLFPQLHFPSSSSVMAPFFANQSCDPWTPESRPCLLGNYVDYAVNVSSPSDVIAAVTFAQEKNIRFVIRNTGHDYQGRSTGAGALSVWTHHLKDIEFVDWADENYEGKAIKMGAGVQAFEAMEAARDVGLVTVGGECPTVGIVGGYTQGGGHSALSTNFGLGADQALSWEIVTANGTLVNASREENSDLYWAMSGGGPGTYGVALSMTAKAHPADIVGGATVGFAVSDTVSLDLFYAGVEVFHSYLPSLVDSGTMIVYFLGNSTFDFYGLTAYGKTGAEVANILSPFLASLGDLGLPYTVNYTTSATYVDHYNTYFGPLPYGNLDISTSQYGGRLIPRSTIEHNLTEFMTAVRNITSNDVKISGVGLNVSSTAGFNAVLPAWRTTLIHMILITPWSFTAPWSDMIALQEKLTYEIEPQMQDVTGVSGVYMNEADFKQPNWQEELFGSNYGQLLEIKKKWDPDHLLYALHTVGSDAWSVAEDGRMCRT